MENTFIRFRDGSMAELMVIFSAGNLKYLQWRKALERCGLGWICWWMKLFAHVLLEIIAVAKALERGNLRISSVCNRVHFSF